MKKIAVVLSRVPFPLEKGDKLRAFNQIKQLSAKYEVFLFALNDPATPSDGSHFEMLKKYCSCIEIVNLTWWSIGINIVKAFLNGLPLQVGYFYSNKVNKTLQKWVAIHKPDHIYCQLVRTAEYVKNIKGLPKTIDYMDALSKGVERRIPKAGLFFKTILKLEWQRLKKYEAEVLESFDYKTIISLQDRDYIIHPENATIKIVSNGVDINYFKPVGLEKKYEILFSGNMGYPPNVEAALYLVKRILPLIKKVLPDVHLVIAGANPSASVNFLRSAKIIITGWVEDMRPYYDASKVFIAPMQTSIGMQNKILEAMAMKVPCITSPMANNAINAREGEAILIGRNPEEYVAHLIHLLQDEDYARKLGENGRTFVEAHYNWESATAPLLRIFT